MLLFSIVLNSEKEEEGDRKKNKKKEKKKEEPSRWRWHEGKKEVMLRVFWGKVKYIEGILGIEILFCGMEGKNEKKKRLKMTRVPLTAYFNGAD
jgi:hypothetical protein